MTLRPDGVAPARRVTDVDRRNVCLGREAVR